MPAPPPVLSEGPLARPLPMARWPEPAAPATLGQTFQHFAGALLATMRRWEAAGRAVEMRQVRLGPFAVRLCFFTRGMIPAMTRALQHAEPSGNGPADLRLWVADSRALGLAPPADWPLPRLDTGGGRVQHIAAGWAMAQVNPERDWEICQLPQREGVVWAADADSLPEYEHAMPLRNFAHWLLAERPQQIVHAATLGTAEAGVLLTGPSGSGKSTTTFSCVGQGLGTCGDDFVLVDCAPPFRAACLYDTVKLDAAALRRLPDAVPLIANPGRPAAEKARLHLHGVAGALVRDMPLKAIFVPRVAGGRDSRLSPLPPAQALRAMAPTTLMMLPGMAQEALAKLARLTGALPCYRLDLGTDRDQLRRLIGGFVAEAAHG